jgi:hypothetical protein
LSHLDESPATFKASKEFHDWLNRFAGQMDISESKLIRAAILLSAHTLRANPHLIEILDNGPMPGHGDQ